MNGFDFVLRPKRPACQGQSGQENEKSRRGRQISSRRLHEGETLENLDLGATVVAAAERLADKSPPRELRLSAEDVRLCVRHQRPKRLVVLVVDTSDSMGDGPEEHMAAALGTAIALTAKSYLNRDRVGLIVFRDQKAQVLVPPTNSINMVRNHLRKLPVGGATPLASALQETLKMIRQARCSDPTVQPVMVLISDGEATVPLSIGSEPLDDALSMAQQLKREKLSSLFINTGLDRTSSGTMTQLARIFGTECCHIQHLESGQLLSLLNQQSQENDP